MSVTAIGLLFLLFGFLTLKQGPLQGVYFFVPATLLGASAALVSGGSTVQPAHLLLGFLALATIKQAEMRTALAKQLSFPEGGFWLTMCVLYSAAGAYIFPRLFSGASYVITVGTTDSGPPLLPVPIGPTTGNFTQSAYFIADLICFLTFCAIGRTRTGVHVIAKALIAYSAMNIVFALFDLATYWTNTDFLMNFMRNANYSVLNDSELYGLKRIIGSFTEASAFSYATIGIIGLCLRLWLGGIYPRLTLCIALINIILVLMCTSSTGYIALPLLVAALYMTSLWRLMCGEQVPGSVYAFLFFMPLLMLGIILIIQLVPSLATFSGQIFNDLVLEKGISQSGLERASWNQMAIDAFLATFGAGAGTGTVRASSFPLAVLANIGIVGAITYSLFIITALLRPASRPSDHFCYQIRSAARAGCLSILGAATISGTLIDLGLPFFIMAALASAAGQERLRHSTHAKIAIAWRR